MHAIRNGALRILEEKMAIGRHKTCAECYQYDSDHRCNDDRCSDDHCSDARLKTD
jgi:hypothetical protein